MVALRAMLMVLAVVSCTAEKKKKNAVEIGIHHFQTISETKSDLMSNVQTKSDLLLRDAGVPFQQVVADSTKAVPDLSALSYLGAVTSDRNAAVMLMVLCFLLCVLVWTQRSTFQNSSKTEMFATSCVFFYMVLTIAVDVLIRKFHQQGDNNTFQFSPAVMTTLIEIGKLAVMIVGAGVDWKNTRECSFAEIKNTMLLMTIPAACFVALNLGRYLALSGADLDQYRVWRSTDILFVACIWFTMSKKIPGRHQIAGIALVFFSCAIMHLSKDKKATGQISPLAIMVILGIAFVASLGLVMNEFGLKASTQLSLFVQSICLYFLTTVLNSVVVVATVPRGQWLQGIGSPQVTLIVLDVMLGLSVACVLKYANAMVKQLASGWLAPLEPLVGHFVVGTPVTPTMVFATMFAGAGSIIYRLPQAEGKEEKGALPNEQPQEAKKEEVK